jgi:hypothetical protein
MDKRFLHHNMLYVCGIREYEVLMGVPMKIVFWDMMQYTLADGYHSINGTYLKNYRNLYLAKFTLNAYTNK